MFRCYRIYAKSNSEDTQAMNNSFYKFGREFNRNTEETCAYKVIQENKYE